MRTFGDYFTGPSFEDRKNFGKPKLMANGDLSQEFERFSTEIAIQQVRQWDGYDKEIARQKANRSVSP